MTAAWVAELASRSPEELLRGAEARLKIAAQMEKRGQPGAAGYQRRLADAERKAARATR